MPSTSAQHATRPAPGPPGDASPPRGEAALRASILDALGEAVVATDLSGRIIYWNAAARDLYGWTAEESIGAHIATLLAADGTRADAAAILRHLRIGQSWSGDFFVRHRDGHSFPVHATTTPVRDRRGRGVGMVGIARDLSAQREAEEALRRAEERLELVHRAAVSVIWEWDLVTGERRWNDSLADAFGYEGAEVDGSVAWWEERIHPEDRGRVRSTLEGALREGRRFWTEEYRFLRQDGTYATVFDRGYVAHGAQRRPVRMVGTLLDLTERRRSHEAARFLSQAGMLLDLSLDYAAVLPGVGRLATQTVADACALLVGTMNGVEEVVAMASDPARQAIMERIADRLAAGALAGTLSERVLRSGQTVVLTDFAPEVASGDMDEEVRTARVEAALPRIVVAPMTARGEVVGVVLLGWTADRPAPGSEEVRVAEELGRRLGLAVDNARLFHSAEVARRAKTDFLSVISHELRTPLTAVMGYADLLSAQIAGTLNAAQQHQVSRLRAGADKLLRVIEGILAYARLEAGSERPQLERVPLDRVLERVRDVVVPHAAERDVSLSEDLAEAPATVCVDVEKMSHVLVSLLLNAVKYSRAGGSCGLRVASDGDTVVFDVSDRGPGIAPDHLPNLFSPFWQAEEPEVRRSGGAGLGLSVARRIARLMGGDVVVLDTSPAGTVFRATVPVRAGD